uniref:SSD domain-containing protein n=1 Tax=Scylla olivacea TaxID=85551 RepID=A0A0P4VX70_SCYOL
MRGAALCLACGDLAEGGETCACGVTRGAPQESTHGEGTKAEDAPSRPCCRGAHRCGAAAVGGLAVGVVQRACEAWGRATAAHPARAVVVVVAAVAVCSLGFLNLRSEWRHYHLWVPQDSLFAQMNAWRTKHFTQEPRTQVVLWHGAGGVLTAAAVQDMWRLHQRVAALEVTVGGQQVGWQDVCLRVPRPPGEGTNISVAVILEKVGAALGAAVSGTGPGLPSGLREELCGQVEAWPTRCLEHSLLGVWGEDAARIANLTDQQVLQDVNAAAALPPLGGVRRDGAGRVVVAASALHTWTTRVQTRHKLVLDHSSARRVDQAGLQWEEALVGEVQDVAGQGGVVRPLVGAAHSLGKAATDAVTRDLRWTAVGGVVVVVYVVATLPRPLLALLGLVVGVPLTLLAAYGLCAALAVPFSFLNAMLPVLVAGLGIDDMYVLAAAWEAVGEETGGVAERGGRALRRVGVAITLTSLTDVLAFLVGASTRLPGLRWFCLYAAAATACVFLLHVTLFVAALALHHRRREDSASRCVPPWGGVVRRGMARYAGVLLKPWMAPVVVAGALALAGGSAWAAAGLRQQFIQTEWFLPPSSDLHQMLQARHEQFPREGDHGYVYFANVTLPHDLPALTRLAAALRASPYVQSVGAWFLAFQDAVPPGVAPLSPPQFHEALSLFLHSPLGVRYTYDMEFAAPLRCRRAAPRVTAFRMHLQHRELRTMEEQRAALREVRRLVAEAPVGGFRGAWADAYSQWETGAMIGGEAVRGLALVVVMVGGVALAVVGAGRTAVLVVSSVVATLVQVAGVMRAWGLSINTVTAIALVMAAGLSVDYAAHIAHAFMSVSGTRRERVRAALVDMGPPVLHAGVSTLLAFAALAPCTTYLFTAYFRILTSVAALSLLQALLVLPVLLTLMGPATHHTTPQEDTSKPPTTPPNTAPCTTAPPHTTPTPATPSAATPTPHATSSPSHTAPSASTPSRSPPHPHVPPPPTPPITTHATTPWTSPCTTTASPP